MHIRIYREFEEICRSKNMSGTVLEVGATPDESSLLNMDSLKGAKEKVGINLDGPHDYKDFHILRGDANAMTAFTDNRFDVVLCNSVLEHDKYFWKTISEIKRVTKPGGLIVIGTPGYGILPFEKYIHMAGSTLTMRIHNYPGDYYRFSKQIFEEFFFAGLKDVTIRTLMIPPRIIGVGIKV